MLLGQAGDTVHILHVIAPARRLVVTPDMGLEGVIEDDEETRRKVVSSTASTGSNQRSVQTAIKEAASTVSPLSQSLAAATSIRNLSSSARKEAWQRLCIKLCREMLTC